MFKAAWEAAGNTEPPSSHGLPYDLMQDDPATELDKGQMFEPHHDRHVWMHRADPSGVFAHSKPRVTSAHRSGGQHGRAG